MSEIYNKLAAHLNSLPSGYPTTDSGVELKILRKLFTEKEAKVATKLTMFPESIETISSRCGNNEDIKDLLFDMSKKGLILRSSKDGNLQYMAAQFVIGIWEYNVNNLDEELITYFNEYVPYLIEKQNKLKTKQLRVIPVAKSVNAEMKIMPYDKAEEIIRSQSKIILAPCICRKEHRMTGKGCGKLEEACLVFGGGAYYYEENDIGKEITQDEALEVIKTGMEQGLVLQPGNSKKPMNICLCCGCCCQILKNIKSFDEPAKAVNSNFYADVTQEECTACRNCEAICPMDAIEIDDYAVVNTERCIGCGVCIGSCDFSAISLYAKVDSEKWVPPENFIDTYINIATERQNLNK